MNIINSLLEDPFRYISHLKMKAEAYQVVLNVERIIILLLATRNYGENYRLLHAREHLNKRMIL